MARWPSAMPWLTPKDFSYGRWVERAKRAPDGDVEADDDGEYLSLKRPDEISCGTRCCLVGHVRHAFGEPAGLFRGTLPAQGETFLRRFLMEAGYPNPGSAGKALEEYASSCFEGHHGRTKLSVAKATKAWRKTLKHFGYTEVS